MLLAKPLREAHWEPAIGDPTVVGWVTVACYALAALLCLACWRGRMTRLGLFWLVVASGMLLLAVNKQLDLQALVHATGRNMAIRQGWFDRRHAVVRAVFVALGVVGLLSVALLVWLVRGVWADVRLAVGGLVLLAGFAVLRAAELLEIERLTRVQLFGAVYVSSLIELTAIALVIAGAWRHGVNAKTTGHTPVALGPDRLDS